MWGTELAVYRILGIPVSQRRIHVKGASVEEREWANDKDKYRS